MKALVFSTDDIPSLSKLIYNPKSADRSLTAGLEAAAAVAGVDTALVNGNNLMALQYYLKHPGNYQPIVAPVTTANAIATRQQLYQQQQHHQQQQQQQQHHSQQVQQHQHVQVSSPSAATTLQHQQLLLSHTHSQPPLKQIQLKQPTIHQQHANYHHHHPYYQHTIAVAPSAGGGGHTQAHTQIHTTHHHHHNHHIHSSHSNNHNNNNITTTNYQNHIPVHALNQNSNFSAASSSTGGGTASSHAPTQQSNGSSISPTTAVTTAAAAAAAAAAQHKSSINGNKNSASAAAAAAAAASTAHGTNIAGGGAAAAANSLLLRTSTTNCAKKLKTEPILSQLNQTERLNFANTHIVWSEEHWKRVVFQDERKFNLDGPDGFSYYFHDLRNYERSLSQRPRGNSVFIYLLVTVGGAIHLEVSTAKQRIETCIETILRERQNIINKLGGNSDFILQDHNWMTNALPSVQDWLNSEGLKTQKWPTVAHDLNIMENIWGWLIREVFDGGRKFSRKDDLIFRIREAWTRLPLDFITNLYSTLPERITELYYTRGIYTNC